MSTDIPSKLIKKALLAKELNSIKWNHKDDLRKIWNNANNIEEINARPQFRGNKQFRTLHESYDQQNSFIDRPLENSSFSGVSLERRLQE